MASLMPGKRVKGLERSCSASATDWIRIAPASRGLERIEAYFAGRAFEPHRHDTYAMGFTLSGVQAFRYRGAAERCVPGQVFVLHPDETHDGHAGSSAGFRYRILYIEPRAIHEALGARGPLPFVRTSVSRDRRLAEAMQPALADLELPLEELARDELILEIAEALAAADPSFASRKLSARHWRAVGRAREFLDVNIESAVTSTALEEVAGLSRYALARQFRACLGTSPYRYLTLRRLDRARMGIREGISLAEAAAGAGFADQSHMTRHFKRAFGLSPGRYRALAQAAYPERT